MRRLAYAFLDREGMRTDEMASLKLRDIDLKRGRVVLDTNKTDDPRDWDLRPDVVEALRRWKEIFGALAFVDVRKFLEKRTVGTIQYVRTRDYKYHGAHETLGSVFRYCWPHYSHRPFHHKHVFDVFNGGTETIEAIEDDAWPHLSDAIQECCDWVVANHGRINTAP